MQFNTLLFLATGALALPTQVDESLDSISAANSVSPVQLMTPPVEGSGSIANREITVQVCQDSNLDGRCENLRIASKLPGTLDRLQSV